MNHIYQRKIQHNIPVYEIDITDHDFNLIRKSIKEALGSIVSQYIQQDERPYGYQMIALLDQNGIFYLLKIPSKNELQPKEVRSASDLNKKSSGSTPFVQNVEEVSKILDMFTPFLYDHFAKGKPAEVQQELKDDCICCKALVLCGVVIIFIFIVGMNSVSNAITAAVTIKANV